MTNDLLIEHFTYLTDFNVLSKIQTFHNKIFKQQWQIITLDQSVIKQFTKKTMYSNKYSMAAQQLTVHL